MLNHTLRHTVINTTHHACTCGAIIIACLKSPPASSFSSNAIANDGWRVQIEWTMNLPHTTYELSSTSWVKTRVQRLYYCSAFE